MNCELPIEKQKGASIEEPLCPDEKSGSEGHSHKVMGRFAPTPSGLLHIGNLFSFLVAYLHVRKLGGNMRLRIEDLDPARSKQHFIDAIFRDFEWAGFDWDGEVVYQSARTEAYETAFKELQDKGLIYPCFCTRADLHAASAPHWGEELVYPGTCRSLSVLEREEKACHRDPSQRVCVSSKPYSFEDLFQGDQSFNLEQTSGDFVLQRSDSVYAYQLAVVVDDALMGVNSVIRGLDLLPSAPRQMFLQEVLGFPHPVYGHIPLIVDADGRRLAKRASDTSIESLRTRAGISAAEVLGKLAFATGMIEDAQSCSIDELVTYANLDALKDKQRIFVDLGI